MKKHITLSIIISTALFGAGYQNPNNSINSSALSTANIANANGADAAYYNPANMVNNISKKELEIAITYILLNPINYDSKDGNYHIKSKQYNTLIPSLHYVSDKLNEDGIRVGLSIISPAGLSREWEDFPATPSAKEFALQTLEFNPSAAIPFNDKISFGFGLRYMKALAQAKLDGSMLGTNAYTLDMDGKADAYGYNLALAYKYSEALNMSVTYRSKLTLDLEGDADVTLAGTAIQSGVSLEVPIPANFILATAYKFNTGTIVEITYDRTMWSVVNETDFNYDNAIVEGVLGASQEKKWHDTVAYRLGITQELDSATLMAGYAYANNAADEEYVSFSSPESDSFAVSFGGRYNISNTIEVGLAMLYTENKSRTVTQATNPLGVNGTLSDKSAYSATIGASFKF